MNSQSQDGQLFLELKRGNRLALQTLFTAYYEPLCNFALYYGLVRAEAEEIVSDVFFILWKKRETVAISQSVKAYLYACVKHAALALVKRKEVLNKESLIISTEVVDNTDPLQMMEYTELDEELNKAIETLPNRCRQVFILNRFDGLKYKEIGELLNLSEKTVENHIVKALSDLKAHVGRHLKLKL